MFKFISIIILFVSSFTMANDTIKSADLTNLRTIAQNSNSDRLSETERPSIKEYEYQSSRDEGLNEKPQAHCLSENTMLDRIGCLQADGKIAKHCAMKYKPFGEKFNPCDKGFKNVYICRDYAICLKNESGDAKTQEKKQQTEKSKGIR